MAMSTDNKLYRIVSDVLGMPPEDLNDSSGPDSVETWDSMSHVHLVLSLEAEFGLSLTPEEAMGMMSIGEIRAVLADHGVTFPS